MLHRTRPPDEREPRMRHSLFVCIALAVATLIVFGQVISFDFVNYDDPFYATQNPHVQQGLSLDGLHWAFTTGYASSWQPVTWISHMLDSQMYGLNPAGHHATNLLLHLANVLLLFGLLRWMTRDLWPSAFVAALFALHPLRVEAVAWIASRNHLLGTLFGLASMGAYVVYARRPGAGRYLLVALCLAVGLMSKPMLVTLPLVYLLLDYWPLERIRLPWRDEIAKRPTGRETDGAPKSLGWVVAEKVPFLALAAGSSYVTFLVQEGGSSITGGDVISFRLRAANAVVCYARYLGKLVWPADLSVHYPHPYLLGGTPYWGWQIAGAAVLLVAITAVVIAAHRRRWAAVGWFWYLGTLVPVIGLVQTGSQAMADRYTYLPLVGVLIVIAWGAAELVRRWPGPGMRLVVAAAAAVIVAASMAASWSQARVWRDSVVLFRHALEAAGGGSAKIHNNLGAALRAQSKLKEAVDQFYQALRIDRTHYEAHTNLGAIFFSEGKFEQSAGHFRAATAAEPDNIDARFNLGLALEKLQKPKAAEEQYRKVLGLQPEDEVARRNLGRVLLAQNELGKAIGEFRRIIQLNPRHVEAHYTLAGLLSYQGKFDEAITHYRQALELRPLEAEIYNGLGMALGKAGRLDDAIEQFSAGLRINPRHAGLLQNLAAARSLRRSGRE